MIIETSWDDWHPTNLRLVELLRKYRLPAIFYLPVNDTDWEAVKKEIAPYYEIGCHTVTHPMDMKRLTTEQKQVEIKEAKKMVEQQLGKQVTSFCYPRGRYDDECINIVKEAGFLDARTTRVLAIQKGPDPFQEPTTIHFFHRKEYEGRPLLEVGKERFKAASKLGDNGYFHLWGHSWEVDKLNLWGELEEFFQFLRAEIDRIEVKHGTNKQ